MFFGVLISLGIGILSFFHTKEIPSLKSEVDMLNTPVTDPRSGKTYLMPAGMLIDSLKKEK